MLCGLDHHLYQLRLLGCYVNLFSLQSLRTATRGIIFPNRILVNLATFNLFLSGCPLRRPLFFAFFYHQKALTVMVKCSSEYIKVTIHGVPLQVVLLHGVPPEWTL